MKLSVIIVNYNVKYFLEQCLHSAIKALKNIDGEIIVVDNNSVDGSCGMMHEKFPEIKLIENKQNTGFSYANNQAIKISKGEYSLLLNPDTVVEEDTFEKVVSFMDENPDAGGLGVKMIDGNGNFLPESKRGLPSPMVAFYKIFGLSALFPKSKIFGRYHLGFLDNEEIHEVDVLAGAFMLLRKKTLDEVGLLDEDYFMYGEDIDLSYRITKGGYKNYYFPETTIIHYKGESTKKGSINYVRIFYNAMIIFAKKHFTSQNAKLYSFFINLAIYFRAFLSIISRFLKTYTVPILDFIIIYLGYYFFTPIWATHKFADATYYPEIYLQLVVPIYILIWIAAIFFSGGYDKPNKIGKLMRGIGIGAFVILTIYALLPEHWRFSRALILIGTAWLFFILTSYRLLFHIVKIPLYQLYSIKKKRIAIIADNKEIKRIDNLLKQTELKHNIVGYIYPKKDNVPDNFIGNISQINEIVEINKIDELIFSGHDLSSQEIIKNMLHLSGAKINYKIAPPESLSIIGSNSINTAGELYTVYVNSINKGANIRNKRFFDFIFSLSIILLSPLLFLFQKKKFIFFKNVFSILFGYETFVGYYIDNKVSTVNLPSIKKGILSPLDNFSKVSYNEKSIEKLNLMYAKDYRIWNDLLIVLKNLGSIGR
jgi:GT2 family glycosyltransferase